jgi:hypothetical protein
MVQLTTAATKIRRQASCLLLLLLLLLMRASAGEHLRRHRTVPLCLPLLISFLTHAITTPTRPSLPDVGSFEDAYDNDDDAMGDDSSANILAFDGEQEQTVVVEEDETDQNIVGGTSTNGQKDAPFFVRGESGCGATLIAPDVVLGAAHCAGAFPIGCWRVSRKACESFWFVSHGPSFLCSLLRVQGIGWRVSEG